MPFEFAAVILMAVLAVALTATMLELQTTATAYVTGQAHWSSARQDATFLLHRYATSGDPAQLARARTRLLVPLGDRDARLALERDPPDLPAARRGFLQGDNAPEDIDRMIRLFRYFSDASFFRDSLERWRFADQILLDLGRITDELGSMYAEGIVDSASALGYQQQLLEIDSRLRPLEAAFSHSLVEGMRSLKSALILIAVILFLSIAAVVILMVRSTVSRIRASEGAFRTGFHQAAVGMLKMRKDGRILEANQAISTILGYSPAQLQELNLPEIMHHVDAEKLAGGDEKVLDWASCETPGEHRFLRQDGSRRWLRWSAARVDTGLGDEERVFAIIEDVSESRSLSDEMRYQASHDALTGVFNRREIERRLREGIEQAHSAGIQHAFLFVDLDQFKLINDTCGNVAGDQLLRQIAGILMLHMRGDDWMGRLGSDEFAVWLEATGIEEAIRQAERLSRAVSGSVFRWEGRPFTITCSIGITHVGVEPREVSDILREADRACYQAKEEGRNCIRVYSESDEAMVRRRNDIAWIGEIRQAIVDSRVVLFAQRIENLRGEPGLQYEILVRLVDRDGTILLPDSFLPAAERFGEAVAIDRLVIAMTLRQLEDNPQHLRELDLCHLNVSAQSIANPEFRHHIVDLLDGSQVPGHKLCFELTETAAIGNLTRAREFIDEMRSRGCRIALDDFGSGLSSFAYLKNLQVDVLKIDGIFIRDLASNEVDPVLVRSMCEMARSLGKITVAEWVESHSLLEPLRVLGVDQAQGFGIHKPCALGELIDATPILLAAGNF